MKKICFAILVHNYKESLLDMIQNIRYFCPNSSIVLYNGGDDPELCRGLGLPVCPSSKKLVYPTSISTYMLEVMHWLIGINYEFDFLINLDSDCLFARQGFERFVENEMTNSGYMGVRVRKPTEAWIPYRNFRKEWPRWSSMFQLEELLCCFNVGQIYSRNLVKQIVAYNQTYKLDQKLLQTKSKGIVEIVYVSLAGKLGAKPKAYPTETAGSIRYRPHYTAKEVEQSLRSNPRQYLFHPVYRSMQDDARSWIRKLIRK